MNKSLKRVRAALQTAGLKVEILEVSKGIRTAQAAVNAASCEVDQIAKSIIFRNEEDGSAVIFITAGGKKICLIKASALLRPRWEKRTQNTFAPKQGSRLAASLRLGAFPNHVRF
ncbi:hypothetical protein [Falsihalocynthiibacter arcticus]|uniref:YbaK/aminoacyl-tRNA synthetase-associated domain-containing protein n=1 Tax=Falsihalocynthiibacter arcticus TaxID=1579316 RepID=A0A126V2F2_9RHOB|nr:hypothetical protein [Falsihalocynthiibacter arcticus]AML52502.1 hypothetical protein RC74_15580 [Falsihalocynthiibacter arcticus]